MSVAEAIQHYTEKCLLMMAVQDGMDILYAADPGSISFRQINSNEGNLIPNHISVIHINNVCS